MSQDNQPSGDLTEKMLGDAKIKPFNANRLQLRNKGWTEVIIQSGGEDAPTILARVMDMPEGFTVTVNVEFTVSPPLSNAKMVMSDVPNWSVR